MSSTAILPDPPNKKLFFQSIKYVDHKKPGFVPDGFYDTRWEIEFYSDSSITAIFKPGFAPKKPIQNYFEFNIIYPSAPNRRNTKIFPHNNTFLSILFDDSKKNCIIERYHRDPFQNKSILLSQTYLRLRQ